MYMDFEKAVSFLGRFAPLLRRVPQRIREEVFDVRLSVHRPVMLCCRARILFLKNDGTVSAARLGGLHAGDAGGHRGDLL